MLCNRTFSFTPEQMYCLNWTFFLVHIYIIGISYSGHTNDAITPQKDTENVDLGRSD